MSKNIQVNVALPQNWKEQLERLARIYSVEEERNLSYQDLIRTAVQEKYTLGERGNEFIDKALQSVKNGKILDKKTK